MTTAERIAKLRGLMAAAKAARSFNVSSVKIHTDFLSELEDAAPALLAAAEREQKLREALETIALYGISADVDCASIARAALAQEPE